jgi:hypothetical protein
LIVAPAMFWGLTPFQISACRGVIISRILPIRYSTCVLSSLLMACLSWLEFPRSSHLIFKGVHRLPQFGDGVAKIVFQLGDSVGVQIIDCMHVVNRLAILDDLAENIS